MASSSSSRLAAPRRIASNFALLSAAEIACRATSVAVTLSLAQRLGTAGYGRIEFAFNIVFWLVLLLRDSFEMIAARELARHPRLTRPLVNHILAVKSLIAVGLFGLLMVGGAFALSSVEDRALLTLYGLLLLTTALGLDFVYRGRERMGLVAVSLCLRTGVYAAGVWLWVTDASRIVSVPILLAAGEAVGIGLVWACYARRYGLPRPVLGGRFLRVFLRRGRRVSMIQVSQTVIGSADLLVVGVMSPWAAVGLYGASHRMVTAALTFGLIFQQVVFPSLARSWRAAPEAGRQALDGLVRFLAIGLVPLAVGTTVLSNSLVEWLLPEEYEGAGLLLAIGIWRAPLLALAYLYQVTLIALNRESAGVRMLFAGALASGPLALAFATKFGLAGASAAVPLIGLTLALTGYGCLARERRQPAWHHHLARPVLSSLLMIPVCLSLLQLHVMASVIGGVFSYLGAMILLGGLKRSDLEFFLPASLRKPTCEPEPRSPAPIGVG